MKRILFTLFLALFAVPSWGADIAQNAVTDRAGNVTVNDYLNGYAGTTSYRFTVNSILGLKTSVSGNAGTATALAANGSNCSSGYAPLGVDASGASEGCWQVTPAAIGALATAGTAANSSQLETHAASYFQVALTNPLVAGTLTTGYFCSKNAGTNTIDCNTQYPTASALSAAYIDWNASSGGAFISNKPTLGSMAALANPLTTAGDIWVAGASGAPGRLGVGTDSYVLTISPSTHLPVWAAATGGGYTNLTSFVDQTAWRVFYSDGSGDVKELALGSDGTYLRSNGASSAPTFDTPTGGAHDAVTLSTDLGNNLLGLSTQQITLDNQTANYIFAGPVTGAAAAPAFRALVSADIPANAANTSGTAANVSGTPALPNGTTATTQSAGDNSTKLATTAYANALVADTAYDATSWDGVTAIAASKNAVRDYLESKLPSGADGSYGVVLTNNTAKSPTASTDELYFEGNIFKINQNGTEYTTAIGPLAGQITFTGPTAARTVTIADAAQTLLNSTASGVQTFLTSPSSANLASMITDETGSGVVALATSPAFTTDIHSVTAGGATVGTNALPFSGVRIGNAATNNILLTGTAASDVTVTLPSATSTLAILGANTFTGTQALGANNLTMTGSIAATGNRVTKLWATDIESTNMPTVGGTAILSSLTAPQFTTIELGAVSDTTLARVSAGVISVEGATVLTNTTPAVIDGSAHVHLTAAQMSDPRCHVSNYGQTTADVNIGLPAAAANLSCFFDVETAQSNHYGVLAAAGDAIRIVAADGTVGAFGTDADAVVMTAAQAGQSFACWSTRTGASAYDWSCKAVAIGTSTFAAHAAW